MTRQVLLLLGCVLWAFSGCHRSLAANPSDPTDPSLPEATLEQAKACRAVNGAWRCPALRPPTAMPLGVSSNVIPTSWTVANWFIDRANSSGCASDTNDCQHSACSGSQGPCSTYHEIHDARWGCLGDLPGCPRLRQATTLTFMSSDSGDTDPVYFSPAYENNIQITLKGTASTTATSTLGTTSVINRTTGQLTQSVFGAGVSTASLITNSTHPSQAWIYFNVSGTTFTASEPLTSLGTVPVEVNTWTSGDSFTAQTVPSVNLVSIAPIADNSVTTPVIVSTLKAFDPNPPAAGGANPTKVAGLVFFENVFFQRSPYSYDGANSVPGAKYINCEFTTGAWLSSPAVASPISGGFAPQPGPGFTQQLANSIGIYGGIVQGGGFTFGYGMTSINFDYDVILNSAALGIGGTSFWGCVFVDSATYMGMQNGYLVPTNAGACGTNAILWGSGIVDMEASSRLSFNGATAANSFLGTMANAGHMMINGQTTACSSTAAGTPVFNCNIALTAAHLDAAAGAAGFGGTAFRFGSTAVITNGF